MSTYKGIVKTNKLTGSPVGVTIAEIINMNINNSALFSVSNWIFNNLLFKRNNVTRGSWKVIANKRATRVMNW